MFQFIKTRIIICQLLFTLNAVGQAKSDFPTIGMPMPTFDLHDVNFYPTTQLNNEALIGKWYMLDFWIKNCSPCIESFPKISNMVKEFKNKVEIIQIGIGGNELKKFAQGKESEHSHGLRCKASIELVSKIISLNIYSG